MRSKYDSREMEGMLRAWNVRGEFGDARDERDAVVRVCHMGGCSASEESGRDTGGVTSAAVWRNDGGDRASFAVAI